MVHRYVLHVCLSESDAEANDGWDMRSRNIPSQILEKKGKEEGIF
jgi:hypothetical protein